MGCPVSMPVTATMTEPSGVGGTTTVPVHATSNGIPPPGCPMHRPAASPDASMVGCPVKPALVSTRFSRIHDSRISRKTDPPSSSSFVVIYIQLQPASQRPRPCTTAATANQQWWPERVDLAPLRCYSPASNPLNGMAETPQHAFYDTSTSTPS
jgi:hypothetical protein